MDASITIARIAGIDIRMHLTFPLILIWAGLQFGLMSGGGWLGALFGVVVTLLLFTVVVLHELGHSLAARAYHVPVRRITLLPIGGVAELERPLDRPAQELVVAIAGPLVNALIAILLWPLWSLAGLPGPIGLDQLTLLESQLFADFGAGVYRYIFIANLMIGVFNLLPAFPLDGGRVFRALLALKLSYGRATTIAVAVGRTFAWLIGVWGVLTGNLFTVVLAVFIYIAAGQEQTVVVVRRLLGGARVADAYSRRLVVLTPTDPVSRAVDATLGSFQSDFPVCDASGQLVGLLSASDLFRALRQQQSDQLVASVMRRDMLRTAPDESIFEVQQKMAVAGVDAVPVVDGERLIGLLTNRDIAELYQVLLAGRSRPSDGPPSGDAPSSPMLRYARPADTILDSFDQGAAR